MSSAMQRCLISQVTAPSFLLRTLMGKQPESAPGKLTDLRSILICSLLPSLHLTYVLSGASSPLHQLPQSSLGISAPNAPPDQQATNEATATAAIANRRLQSTAGGVLHLVLMPETFHDLLAAPRSRCATTRASSKRPDGRQLTHSRTVLFSRCGQGGPATNHPLAGEPPMHSLRMAGDSAGVRTGGVERNWFRHPLAASPHPRPSRASTPPQPSPPGTFATLQHGPWRRTRAMLCAVALSPLRARHDAATGVRVGPVHHRPPPTPLSPGLSEGCAYRKNPAALG
jgi:hypothetical protein